MPEVNQYTFSHKELLEMMLRKLGIHEGKWMLTVFFTFTAATAGPTAEQALPSAIAGVQNVGIQKALPDAPAGLVVDAAQVNPPEEVKSKRKR